MAKTITVKGVGSVKTRPDYVVISLSLNGEDMDYVTAVNKANDKIELLKKALVPVGFAADDLKTLNFSARTVYKNVRKGNEYSSVFAGYAVDYKLKLAFDFTPQRLSEALTAIANSGADAEFSISFTVKEPEKVAGKLLIAATENARQKAEILAKASGKSLGELISIDYNWAEIDVISHSNYAVAAAPNMLREAAVPEFTPDDIESRDSVTFIWEIV
ncbi:MAG: SIMPL domain-containing protein [Oscillospiraceae bacterium]